jgi:hypothetical protein
MEQPHNAVTSPLLEFASEQVSTMAVDTRIQSIEFIEGQAIFFGYRDAIIDILDWLKINADGLIILSPCKANSVNV